MTMWRKIKNAVPGRHICKVCVYVATLLLADSAHQLAGANDLRLEVEPRDGQLPVDTAVAAAPSSSPLMHVFGIEQCERGVDGAYVVHENAIDPDERVHRCPDAIRVEHIATAAAVVTVTIAATTDAALGDTTVPVPAATATTTASS